MKNVIIAGLVGGVILFIWGTIAWVVLPLHTPNLHSMTNEDTVITAMKSGMDRKGVYLFPSMPKTSGAAPVDKAVQEAYEKRLQQGPVGMVIYDPNGTSTMMPMQLVVGFINGVLSAMLAAWLLSRSTAASSTYFARVTFCGTLGIFAALVTHVVNWNWMGYPLEYTTGLVADTVIGWVLAGLGIGVFVRVRS